MHASPLKIRIDIADQTYIGDDRCASWQVCPRDVKPCPTPLYLGIAAEKHAPLQNPQVEWDFIYLSVGGFGVAVNHETVPNRKANGAGLSANVFITTNPSLHWLKNSLRLSLSSRMRSVFSRPVEQFHSLAVTPNRTVILAWEDPWIMQRARTHIIYSNNKGMLWRYRCLKNCNPHLSVTPDGQILCFSNTDRCSSRDGGKHWHWDPIRLDIYDDHPDVVHSHIQQATFVTEQRGFALLARFKKIATMARPETIVLLTTDNTGLHWHGIAEFPFPGEPALGDPKHILSLNVASP